MNYRTYVSVFRINDQVLMSEILEKHPIEEEEDGNNNSLDDLNRTLPVELDASR